MAATDLTLRRATVRDGDLLLGWANDPGTRAGSFTAHQIDPADHRDWMRRSLEGARHLLVAELGGEPVGLLRLEAIASEPAVAEISLVIAPAARGRGLAALLLTAGRNVAGQIGFAELVARVRSDNARSIRAFERAGYRRDADQRVQGVSARRYVRSTRDD